MLRPLLFIIVLGGISTESRSGCQGELFSFDDLALVNETLEVLKDRLEAWKRAL